MKRGSALMLFPALLWMAGALPGQAPALVESRGVRLQVPAAWSANRSLVAAGGPISLTNFGGAYLRGGLLPPNGAEIEITSIPLPSNLVEYIRKELKGAALQNLAEATQGGKTGVQAAYSYPVPGGGGLANLAFYTSRGTTLYKFYLSYWSGNPNEGALSEVLAKVVGEAQLR